MWRRRFFGVPTHVSFVHSCERVQETVLGTYSSMAVVSAPAMRRLEAVMSISSYEMPVGVSRFLMTCSMLDSASVGHLLPGESTSAVHLQVASNIFSANSTVHLIPQKLSMLIIFNGHHSRRH